MTKASNPTRRVWHRLAKQPTALFGLVLLLTIAVLAILAPVIAPQPENAQNWQNRLLPPSPQYPLGTDEFGRSVLSRVLYGGQVSLIAGLVPVIIGLSIGTLIGLVAGYWGGRLDSLFMRLMDVLLAFPSLFLALAIVGIFGPSLLNAVVAIGVVSIPGYARLARAEVLRIKSSEFIEAALAMGASHFRILWRYVLPNAFSPLLVQATLGMGGAILATAGLSFLGLGVQPPTSDWGEMLSSGRRYLPEAWWLAFFPGVCIALTILAINLLGDGLRDALDPRTR